MKDHPSRHNAGNTRAGQSVVAALQSAARAAGRRAYAPYSGFRVGASVLTAGRAIFAGCNVENASYGLTICAERAAVAAAVGAGHDRLLAVCVAAAPPVFPCGACRQVLAEFADAECVIYITDFRERRRPPAYRLAELLPHAFNADFRSGVVNPHNCASHRQKT